ncbi:ABC transporter substrate-binding protein [Agrobacterium genomosp. 2]|uniref:Sugar ABC transporter substrate-binding protein n=1 Tax=Agrobacterium genomosp. 2 str. CFBP 5494 TaxID=1183436 RepID=A0A9W5F648_9HYPH|nr:sugar ABC transporter substrate-binding protein [Agrobacterium genomosp. 2]CUX03267.1 Sugar ABC transporter substrate-binding protein [Agrobacterium genomosp. 2 str. CFBP 5494]
MSARIALALASLSAFSAAPAFAQEPVTLQFWEAHSAQEEAATIKMIDAFHKSHPNIKVNRVKTSFGTNFEAITTALASKTAPDVSPIWSGFLSQFAASGALVDLKKFGAEGMTKELYPGAFDYVQWNQGIYGLPYAFDPRFIVYNEQAMKEAGIAAPAKTFDELVEHAEKLGKASGGQVSRYGFGLASADALAYFFINALYANGGEVFSKDGKEVAFNSEAGVKAGAIIAKLASNKNNTLNSNPDVVRQGVLTGRIGMVFDGPWVFWAARSTNGAQPVTVGSMPVVKAGDAALNFGSVGGYVVYAQSKHPEQAAEFVKFMASPEAQQFRVEGLKTGVTPGVVDEPAAKAAFEKVPALKTAQMELNNSRIFPKHEKWSTVFQSIIPAVEAIISGDDPKSALDGAARQANRGLRR